MKINKKSALAMRIRKETDWFTLPDFLSLQCIGFVASENEYLAVTNNLCTLYLVALYITYALFSVL